MGEISGDGMLINGDCQKELKKIPENSIDTVITDPPYGLSSHKPGEARAVLAAWMAGKSYRRSGKGILDNDWDVFVPGPEIWAEAYRVMKPGAMAMVFGGARTFDYTTIALRLSGFLIPDVIMWIYGDGMPKGQNLSKVLDKKAGAERPIVGKYELPNGKEWMLRQNENSPKGTFSSNERRLEITGPATPEATLWDGWHTGLKPAYEPIIIAVKPPEGTWADNIMKWGVGGYHIEPNRIPVESRKLIVSIDNGRKESILGNSFNGSIALGESKLGRFPANVIVSQDVLIPLEEQHPTASGFFYCSKVSRSEKNKGLNKDENIHDTVKPIRLMKYLTDLSKTPTGGNVLDPFMGSGTTGIAAKLSNRPFIGIEKDPRYFEIAKRRIERFR